MKIAVLNISIGNYDVFWKDFYVTAESNFLPGHEKHYYVFTDNMTLYGADFENITLIKEENLGWPFNTMKRYHMFLRIVSQLVHYDYVFFVNGNAIFKEKLTEDFINTEKEIITIVHPGLYNTPLDKLPYERNPLSNAYIKEGEGKFYVQGAFIGGRAQAFIRMTVKLNELTEEDLSKSIIAIWHDESFLNKYILNRTDVQVLGRQYLYYEEYIFPWKPIIMLRNKRAYGNLRKFRGLDGEYINELVLKIKLFFRNVIHKCLIFLHIEKRVENVTNDGKYIEIDLN